MPPFAGEGMCAGLRDAVNLSWKLDLILQNQAKIDLLDAYTSERKPHIKWYINFSVELGKVICVTDPEEAAKRDRDLIAAHEVQKNIGPISPHQAVLGEGIWSASDKEAGLPAIQGRVAYKGMTGRFDTVATRGWSLVTLHESGEALSPDDAKTFEKIGGKQFKVGLPGSGAELIDIDGAYTNWLKLKGATHLLVRPDFYVGFVATGQTDLDAKIKGIFDLMHLSQKA
jgi:3-(3-hydroxy-phenyl)propionate hydroxylase